DLQRINADSVGASLNAVMGAFRDPDSIRPDLDTISFYFDTFASVLRNDSRS
ncbi:hypothetical protein LCGC14_1748820, partial [marine sediment metagenome]